LEAGVGRDALAGARARLVVALEVARLLDEVLDAADADEARLGRAHAALGLGFLVALLLALEVAGGAVGVFLFRHAHPPWRSPRLQRSRRGAPREGQRPGVRVAGWLPRAGVPVEAPDGARDSPQLRTGPSVSTVRVTGSGSLGGGGGGR